MDDLFAGRPSGRREPTRDAAAAPLADRLRPQRTSEVVGQARALDPSGPIGRMLARRRLASLILWGPPGCGKTTIARLLAQEVGEELMPLSAVMAGVADVRKAFETARKLNAHGRRPILFIDEIHRFNRAQQDGLLHEVEDGTVTLIGATTENPSFALNAALVSRCQVVVLDRLDEAALGQVLGRAEAVLGRSLPLEPSARGALIELADGDGRYLLNMVEQLADLPGEPRLEAAALSTLLQRRMPVYDKQQEAHYNLISALHKAVRGSDADAALYWFARMIRGGEDPRYIARRLVRMAAEDIGLAAPGELPRALAAARAYEQLGSPEGELMLAQTVIALALAPKSNAAYLAYKRASRAAAEHGSLMPPLHVRNAPTKLMKQLGYGSGYDYDHDAPDAFSGQNYFPDTMPRERYYEPTGYGEEALLEERLRALDRLRAERAER